MKTRPNLVKITENYIESHGLQSSPEDLFALFERMWDEFEEFKEHLKTNKMHRDHKKLEKRRVFMEWYFQKHQNRKSSKEIWLDLSEFLFITDRSVKRCLYEDTTD